jgi:hypothetical protein
MKELKSRNSKENNSDEKVINSIQEIEDYLPRLDYVLNSHKTRLFQVVGGYDDVRQTLLRRGWIESSEPNSMSFDFRWGHICSDIDFKNLKAN